MYLLSLPKLGTNLLTPPFLMSYSFAILLQKFDYALSPILSFSGANG